MDSELERHNSRDQHADTMNGVVVTECISEDNVLSEKINEISEIEKNNPENTENTPSKSSQRQKDSTAQKMLIDINFCNKKTYFAFHEEFLDVIRKYYKDKIDDLDIADDASNKRICISEKLVKKSDSFLIDTSPSVSIDTTPRYTSFSTKILSNTKNAEEKTSSTANANRCFNCGKSTHSLRDCPEPRNLSKIRKARNDFGLNRKELRYCDDNGEYSHMIPGQLSAELEEALGLTKGQLPLHVYKMRKYGYPPSWLEEAKIVCSSGLEILDDKVNFEHDESHGIFKYDIQKIYDFPGFNVPPTSTPFIDKHRLLDLPPMQPYHSKNVFIQSLGDNVANGYKKKKMKKSTNILDTSSNIENTEMDIDDDVYITEIDESPKSPVEDGELSNNSFENLENERNKLLDELSDMNNRDSIDDCNNKKIETIENASSESNEQHGHVETTIFGCPLLPSFSKVESLPSDEKFKEGVSDVIAFENLAESTGKYEKMRGLLEKVRHSLKEVQKE